LLKAFRITKTKYKDTAFDGYGSAKYGGRWNRKGSRIVYLADSPALATLEILAHLNYRNPLGLYSLLEVSIPADLILTVSIDELPHGWNNHPAPPSTMGFGELWVRSGVSAVLQIPTSLIAGNGSNFLINIEHQNAKDIFSTAVEVPFTIDDRLT